MVHFSGFLIRGSILFNLRCWIWNCIYNADPELDPRLLCSNEKKKLDFRIITLKVKVLNWKNAGKIKFLLNF
jgi:hypothetical protein